MDEATARTTAADFPFRAHGLEVDGGRLRYVDEGQGPPVLMVHGTPTWSFLYRHLIEDLRRDHRIVAPDHLGFGRSDKPAEADYRPEAHARNLGRLVAELGLRDLVLVVHDFGGPVGLSYAIDHPDDVRGLVLFNTWMWSLAGTRAEKASRLLGGRLGRFLYTRLDLSPRVLLPAAFGDRRKLTKEIHRRYREPFRAPVDRRALWVCARELRASADWYEHLWNRRTAIADKPSLMLWGMKDPAFGPDSLARWREALADARVVELPAVGHFVPEEAPLEAAREIRSFLRSLPPRSRPGTSGGTMRRPGGPP